MYDYVCVTQTGNYFVLKNEEGYYEYLHRKKYDLMALLLLKELGILRMIVVDTGRPWYKILLPATPLGRGMQYAIECSVNKYEVQHKLTGQYDKDLDVYLHNVLTGSASCWYMFDKFSLRYVNLHCISGKTDYLLSLPKDRDTDYWVDVSNLNVTMELSVNAIIKNIKDVKILPVVSTDSGDVPFICGLYSIQKVLIKMKVNFSDYDILIVHIKEQQLSHIHRGVYIALCKHNGTNIMFIDTECNFDEPSGVKSSNLGIFCKDSTYAEDGALVLVDLYDKTMSLKKNEGYCVLTENDEIRRLWNNKIEEKEVLQYV